jgi:hypothetical protein
MAFLWCWILITLTWIPISGAATSRPTTCKYARFIFSMDCTNVNLDGLHSNMYPVNSPTLLTLILENTGIKTLEPDVFSQLTKLTRLDLSWNQLDTLDYRVFINLTELWNLDITNNRLISLTDDRLFASQLKLKYLKLSNNSLISLNRGVLTPLVSLKYLYLSGNPFVCDCELRDTMLWCENSSLSTNAVCRYPKDYNGSSWQILSDPKICVESRTDSSVKSAIVGVAVTLVILLAVLGLWWFKFKRTTARSDRRHKGEPHDRRSEEN